MRKKELFKRYALFVFSLYVCALGVAFTKVGSLGVSAISSIPNVLSLRFEALTIGNWTFLLNCVFILGQILILGKEFEWIQLLQLPMSFLFGWFTDISVWMVSFIPISGYIMRLAMVVIGVCILALGVTLGVIANVILNAGEGIVKAIAIKTKKEFGNIKVFFDVGCIVTAVILSLILFNGQIQGVREGTLIAAFLNGNMVKVYSRFLKEPLNKALSK